MPAPTAQSGAGAASSFSGAVSLPQLQAGASSAATSALPPSARAGAARHRRPGWAVDFIGTWLPVSAATRFQHSST
jgi:hypothetical protein